MRKQEGSREDDKMVVFSIEAMIRDKYWVKARHPWRRGRLRKALERLGKQPPGPNEYVLRQPPPWSRFRDYLAGASRYQLEAMLAFGEVAHETAGMPADERIPTIAQRLRGKTYGRSPRPPRPLKLDEIRRYLQGSKPLRQQQQVSVAEIV